MGGFVGLLMRFTRIVRSPGPLFPAVCASWLPVLNVPCGVIINRCSGRAAGKLPRFLRSTIPPGYPPPGRAATGDATIIRTMHHRRSLPTYHAVAFVFDYKEARLP